jgi:DNA-binding beta-propeller fold protein YncE
VRPIHEPVHADAVVRVEGGRVFVLNRFFADNVQVLDPRRGFATALQCSTGPGSNPHDVLVLDAHKAYVTRYGERALWIVDPGAPPTCDGFRTGTINLTDFADADGIPEMDQMALAAGRVFVSVQRLDRLREFAPTDQSRLVVIDPATDTVLGSIVLSGRNAFGDASRLAHEPGTGKLLVAEAGNVYRTGDGGIERIDPTAPFERAAEGFIVTEEALGGSITDFVVVSPTKGYAVVTTESIRNMLVAFDPSRGVATRRVLVRDGFLPDVALAPDGTLWLADQGLPVPGIRIFDPRDDRQLTRAPLVVGLPPFSMGFLP